MEIFMFVYIWKNETRFLSSCVCVGTCVWMNHLDYNKKLGEKAEFQRHKKAMCSFEQIPEAVLHKTTTVRPNKISSHKPSK